MSNSLLRIIIGVSVLLPVVHAQVTEPLNSVVPDPERIDSQSSGPTPTITTKAGSVTFTVGAAVYTLVIQGPPSVSGTDNGIEFRIGKAVNFTMTHNMAGFQGVDSQLRDGTDQFGAACELFGGPDYTNSSGNSATCPIDTMIDAVVHGTYIPALELIAHVTLHTSTSLNVYDVHFQWATSATTCPASAAAGPQSAPGEGRARPRDSGCGDTIAFQDGGVFPIPGELIIPTAENKTIPFFAIAKYSLKSQQAAKIVLQLYDQSAKLLGTGPPVLASPDSQTAGGNCVGSNTAGNCLRVPALTYASDATSGLQLVAVMQDSAGKTLAQSNAITYPVGLPKITLTLGSIGGPFTPAPPNTVIEGGTPFEYSVIFPAIQASYDYPGFSANVSVLIQTDQAPIGKTLSEKIGKGAGIATFDISGKQVPTKGTEVLLSAILQTSTGQTYQSPPTSVPMETINRGPATPPENTEIQVMRDPSTNNANTLPVSLSFPVTYQIGPAGATLTETFLPLNLISNDPTSPTNPRKVPVPAGPGQTTVSFTTLPMSVTEVTKYPNFWVIRINADLMRPDGQSCPCARAKPVRYPGFKLVATLPPAPPPPSAPPPSVPVAGGSVTPTQNTTTRNVTSTTNNTDPNSDIGGFRTFSKIRTPHDAARTVGSSTIPDFIAVQRTWQFTPAIPADGSFAAKLTLNYSSADLPDDPNFDASKLQVISYNPTSGAFATYPTSLDPTNNAATAQVNSLEPIYGLAVLGPFSKTMLNAPLYAVNNGFDTKASLVNTGSTDAHFSVSGYSVDGSTLGSSPVAKTLAAHKQLFSSVSSIGFSTTGTGDTGWFQAAADGNSVAGVLSLGNGSQFDALPLVAGHASSSILTDIEFDDTYSTELRIVNPSTIARNLTIDLRRPDGTSVGTYTDSFEAKSSLVNRIEDLFPSIQKPFSGYAFVSANGDVLASSLLFSFSTLTALAAHPLGLNAAGATTLYAERLGAPGQFTRVILVNPGTSDANLTLTAYQANGSVLGSPVAMKLSAGSQNVSDLSTVFNFDPNAPPTGWFKVVSDQPVLGDLTFGDASFFQNTRASVPLAENPSTTTLLAYAENDSSAGTTISIANPNSAPVAVAVTTFASDGTQAGSSTVNIPSNGSATSAVTANLAAGYITLSCTQPVVAFATVTPASGSDFAAYRAQSPAAPALVTPGGSSATPQISAVANAASYVAKLARGSLATIFGSNFMSSGSASAVSVPLPLSLGGVTVTVAGIAAPLIYVSAGQLNFQVPYEVPLGNANVVVTSNGTSSVSFSVLIADYAVGVFTYARTAQALDPIIVHNSTNTLVTPSNPATPGEILIIYATGIGKLTSPPPSGSGASGSSSAVDAPVITVGGAAATVLYAGLTPGFPGLVQFNVQLPATLPSGSLPVVIAFPSDTSAPANLAIQGNSAGSTGGAVTVSPASLDFGAVQVGQTSQSKTITVSNVGASAVTVNLGTSAPFAVSPASLSLAAKGGSGTASVTFTPTAATGSTGTLNITVSGQQAPAASVTLSGTGTNTAPPPANVILSDSFNRANAGACSLGQADLALGGSGTHYYLPIYSGTSGPVGASIVSGTLQNTGLDFGGVQLTASAAACSNLSIRGETLPQDLDISVDLLVPMTGSNVTQAGPYFRSRAAAAGDGIIGGSSAGYWVQLISTGEVRIVGLNPFATIASTGVPASFDSTVKHALKTAVQGSTLQVSLDGKLLSFEQGTSSVTGLTLPATNGSNNGTVGISFGSSDNRGLAGGQRASNLVISAYAALAQ
ncbi:MAG: choice-of-anchor D domain-containing protein [Acidobacteriaceae bacterium]|nr:choice-of-anchor D domain-containing protein [Acidobacteriaceae bacterium]